MLPSQPANHAEQQKADAQYPGGQTQGELGHKSQQHTHRKVEPVGQIGANGVTGAAQAQVDDETAKAGGGDGQADEHGRGKAHIEGHDDGGDAQQHHAGGGVAGEATHGCCHGGGDTHGGVLC